MINHWLQPIISADLWSRGLKDCSRASKANVRSKLEAQMKKKIQQRTAAFEELLSTETPAKLSERAPQFNYKIIEANSLSLSFYPRHNCGS